MTDLFWDFPRRYWSGFVGWCNVALCAPPPTLLDGTFKYPVDYALTGGGVYNMSIIKPALERLLLEAHPRRQRLLNEACKQALETLQKDIDDTVNRGSAGIASNDAVSAPVTDANVDADTTGSSKNSTSSVRSSKRSSVSSMPQATSSPDGLPVLPFDPYWKPFQIALDNTLPVKTRAVALDALSRIIAHKLIASDAHAALAHPFTSQRKSPKTTKVREGTTYFSDVNDLSLVYAHLSPSSVLLSPTTPRLPTTPAVPNSPTTPGALLSPSASLLDDLIDCVCALYYGPSTDESVQLQIIKLLLTVMTSDVTEVHGASLLKIVATLCNMHVYATASVIIANTAKATLTQIVNIVVGRMEACASEVRSMVRGATGEMGDEEEVPTKKAREEAVAEEEKVIVKQMTPESEIEEKVLAEEAERVKMETNEKVGLKPESQVIEDAEEDAVVVEAEETDGYGDFEHVEKLKESEPNSMESSEVVESQITEQSIEEVMKEEVVTEEMATEEVITEEVPFKEIQVNDKPKPRPVIDTPVGRHPPVELRLDNISSPVMQDPMVLRLELLREDVFVLMRLLCKLSTHIEANSKQGAAARPSPPTPLDELNLKGRALVLDLLLSLLNNAGRHLQSHPSAHALLRSHVCVSLSQNAVSSDGTVFELSLSIFLVLVSGFRSPLKPEIEVLITEIYLPILDLPQATYSHRSLILEAVAKIGRNPRTLIDIYLNYDCDMNARSVFERIVASLSRVAQGRALNLGGSKLAGLIGAHSSGLLLDTKVDVVALQERKLKVNGLKCMVEIANSLVEWTDELKPSVGEKVVEQQGEEDDESPKQPMPTLPHKPQQPIIVLRSPLAAITLNHDNHSAVSLSSVGSASEPVAEEPNAAKGYEEIASRKQIMMKGVHLFNDKPDKGIAFLIEHGLVEDTPEGIALFLRSATSGLSKTAIGEYLGEGDAAHIRVMHQFVDQLDFQGLGFVAALRRFLQLYRLPGESQKIDRLMEKFADRYCETNPDGVFANADAAYTLAFSVIMLNTDQHSAQLRSRMTRADFVKNNRGINKNADLPEDYLVGIFDEISKNEIVLDEEVASKIGTRDEKRKVELQVAQMQKKSQQMIMAGQGRDRARMEGFKAAGKSREYVRPMFQALCWPLMATLSLAFEEVGTTSNTDSSRRGSGEGDADWSRANSEAIDLCLEGFQGAIRLAGVFKMEMERDAFVSGLAKLTGLNHVAEMKPKNVAAIRALLNAANRSGEYLDSSWLTVLKIISQMERLQLIGGNEVGVTVFGGGFDYSKQRPATPEEETARARKSIGGTPFGVLLPMRDAPPSPPPTPSTTTPQNSTAAGRFATNSPAARPASLGPLMREFQSQSTLVTIDRVFSGSVSLNGTAIVHFFRALCEISLEEIDLDSGASATPRMYSLQRLIEIAYYNMGRIRFEWVPIWRILQPYFNTVGCHHDARVATFAIDSLRQLSMKLLEREELGHFHTQNEFLKPFEHIMRHAKGEAAGTIRDFIVQSLVQMITARATSIKSGWRSVFVIFGRAAVDQNLALVEYTFGAVQMVYQNCFNYLGSAFVDYVHCLVEFSMNPFLAEDTVLGAVRLLATCGQRMMVDSGLKESEAKDTDVENKDGTTSTDIVVDVIPSTPTSTSWRMSQSLEEEQFFFRWFPVVSALSRIVIESESPRVRSHALDTLFDILRSTGGIFDTAHWRKLYRSALAPLFEDLRSPESRRKHDMIGIWIQTLRQMILLYDMFYDAFAPNPEFLNQIMDLIALMTESKALPTPASGSITTEPSLGQMSVGCLYQLVSQCSTRFDEVAWEAVTRGIEKLFIGTTPIELLEVGEYERRESWKRPLEDDGTPDSPRSDDAGGLHEAKTAMPVNGWPRSRPTSTSMPEQSGQRSPTQLSSPALNGKSPNGFYLDFAAAVVKCGIHLAAIQCVRDLTIEDTSYLPMPTIRQSSTNDHPLSPLPPAYSLARLPAHLRERWTCCLYNSYIFARQFNSNYPLRAYLFRSGYVQQMPNLIKQETLALTVYAAMLFDVYRAIGDGGDPESPAADVVSEAKQMITRFTDLIDAEPAKTQRDVAKNQRDMANWACLPVVVYSEISKTPWWQETIRLEEEQQQEAKGESVRYIALKQEMMWFFKAAVKMISVSNVEVRRSVQDFLEGMSDYLEIV